MQKDLKDSLTGIGVVIVDLLMFFIPLAAIVMGYVIIMKPKWFKEFVDELYREEKK